MSDVLTKSVTRDDYATAKNGGAAIHFMVPNGYGSSVGLLPSSPPMYWSIHRDQVLRSTMYAESMWSSAVTIAVTKMSALGWEVTGDAPRLVRHVQDLLHGCELGRGWVHFLTKHLRDYLCADNGAFVEIIRASKGAGARIVGLAHLDSARCTRTGDLAIPVIYRDKLGALHELKQHQVLALSDMPDPGETYYGVGLCAASRAYSAIVKLAAIERYLLEKVSGSRVLAIHFINGITEKQLSGAFLRAEEEQMQRGALSYKGALVVPLMGDIAPQIVTVPLAELPDGFNRKEEWDTALLTYADAIGLDPQDLQPLGGQSLGTGAQSQVLDDKAGGRGLAAWRQQFTHLLNTFVTPAAVTFTFSERDYRDQRQQAEISGMHVDLVTKLATPAGEGAPGVIDRNEARQMLVDRDVLPREFIAEDTTSGDSLSDAEKPVDAPAPVPVPDPAPAIDVTVEKAVGDDELPGDLTTLIARLEREIIDVTEALQDDLARLPQWEAAMTEILTKGIDQSMAAGTGATLTQAQQQVTRQALRDQLRYLSGFVRDVEQAGAWLPRWSQRAASYAQAVKAPYWSGKTFGLPLPAMPAQGTQCLTQCKCSWDVTTLDADAGDYDATWRRGASDSCQTCVQRASDWAPIRIRGGRLQ